MRTRQRVWNGFAPGRGRGLGVGAPTRLGAVSPAALMRLRLGARRGLMVALLMLGLATARAERPMVVDDASTLAADAAKVEFGWARWGTARQWESSIGAALTETLEIAFGAVRSQERADPMLAPWFASGVGLKWVPWRLGALALGGRLDAARDHGPGPLRARTISGQVLLSWWDEAGWAAHANVGRERVRSDAVSQWASTWAVGGDVAVGPGWAVTLERFGASRARPGLQGGLRYEIKPGLKVSAAWGWQASSPIGNAGIAWEF